MSNEDMIEEILVESYRLGISEKVFDKFKEYILKYERSEAYRLSFNETIKETENINHDEIL
jgi:hypothetical protein